MENNGEIPVDHKIPLFDLQKDTDPEGNLIIQQGGDMGQSIETKGVPLGDLGIAAIYATRDNGYYLEPNALYLENGVLREGDSDELDEAGNFAFEVEIRGAHPQVPITCKMYLPGGKTLTTQMKSSGDHLEKNPLLKNRMQSDYWYLDDPDETNVFFVQPDPHLFSTLRFEFRAGGVTNH